MTSWILPIALQLLLVGVVLERLDMLQPVYRFVLLLCAIGWLIRHVVAVRNGWSWFIGFGVAVLALVLGVDAAAGGLRWRPEQAAMRLLIVIGVGGLMVAVARMRTPFWARVALLAGIGAVAALMRADPGPSWDHRIVLVILASMFMFRIAVYLYDVSTAKVLPPWSRALAYFVPVPNALVPNFPILDYKTFVSAGPSTSGHNPSQRAVNRIVRGMVHLLILRCIEQIHVTPDAVYSGKTLSVYLITNVLTYLRISGSFHIATGALLLLGFDMPRTHVRYFLASGFNDYWRRANTYWRAFLLKVFFYPAVFRLKRLGQVPASLLATAWVFVLSWAFHVYQTWWIWGELYVTLPDALFWAVLGTLVMANTWWAFVSRPAPGNLRRVLPTLLSTCATFATICVAWSLLTSPSVEAWLHLWSYADRFTAMAAVAVLSGVAVAKWALELRPRAGTAALHQPGAALAVASLGVMLCLTLVPMGVRDQEFGLGRLDPAFSSVRLFDALDDGESLPEPVFHTGVRDEGWRQFTEALTRRPIEPTLPVPLPLRPVRDYRLHLLPSAMDTASAFEATSFSTTVDGDRETVLADGADAHAIFLGGSTVMGWGIDDGQTFADRVSRGFDGELGVANLAVHGFSPLSQVAVLANRGDGLGPDVVVLFSDAVDFRLSSYTLHETQRRFGHVPDDDLAALLAQARVERWTRPRLAEKRLAPFETDIVQWSIDRVADRVRDLGAEPVFVVLPAASRVAADLDHETLANRLVQFASDAGMHVVDISDLPGAGEPGVLITGRVPHLTETAHGLIADALIPALQFVLDRRTSRVPPS